jgi:tetratricopeptide (TPR) repeat protein
MAALPEQANAALGLYRQGDLAGARRAAEEALGESPDDPRLLQFLGHLCCRSGDLKSGAAHLHRSLELDPSGLAARLDLAHALAGLGHFTEAEALCAAPAGDEGASAELARIRGFALQELGRSAEAASAYEAAVALRPDDFETWNNLGNARRLAGDSAGAVEALERAVALRPNLAVIRRNLGGALADSGRLEESLDAVRAAVRLAPGEPAFRIELVRALARLGRGDETLDAARDAARAAPKSAEAQVELGLAQAAAGDLGAAEQAYRRAVALQPSEPPAWVHLALLLESGNRAEELGTLARDAEAAGVEAGELAFVRALIARREGRLAEALALAEAAPSSTEPHRKAQLIGEIADRLGDPDAAFAAFTEMNRVLAEAADDPRAGAIRYREELEGQIALATPDWFDSWPPSITPDDRPSPVFLVGFPRSGTTLLDTLLMGHPGLHVVEEQPLLQPAVEALGSMERLPGLESGEIARLRSLYFDALERLAPGSDGKMVVDKMPLNLARAALIHRLFPDARFIFAERHPADVVLSCFITNFRLNYAMANFLDLGDSARTYDLAMTHWSQCREGLGLRVHDLRYEHMVADLEGAVRPLVDFLGLEWDQKMLDHRGTALGRGYVATASYAQVTEPIYARASGRWRRYAKQMEPVLPLLEPWAERLGYEM